MQKREKKRERDGTPRHGLRPGLTEERDRQEGWPGVESLREGSGVQRRGGIEYEQ